MKRIFLSFLVMISFASFSQSIIINEVSQGEQGNQEYIELVVVDTVVSYDCTSLTPPTIDIRNWIIDDNSGYHGSNGVASGAIRFSNDNIWSSLPLGTIILIYNDADFNPEITDGMVELTDGTCQVSVPISSPQYFESNATTPGDVGCSYPSSGWTPGAQWSNISMRNGGDCARIVDLNGCEVFSVCWGDVSDNTVIYFSGTGSNRVYFFNNGNPQDQNNWLNGCADLPNCGTQDQTPGYANNPANQAFLDQFNNSCNPITPISASAIVNPSSNCADVISMTGSGSGSIPGYTYEWFDNTYSNLLDTMATTDSVAIGTYHVIVTSSIGCSDTATVNVTASSNSVTINFVGDQTICEGEELSITASTNLTGGSFDWNNNGPSSDSVFTITPTSSSAYSLEFVLGDCVTDTNVVINVLDAPDVNAGFDEQICEGESIVLNATGANSYVWNNGVLNGASVNPVNGLSTYSVIGTDANGCVGYDTVLVQTDIHPVLDLEVSDTIGNAVLFVDFDNFSNATNYAWDFGNNQASQNTINASTFYDTPGTYLVTLTASNGGCSSTWQQQITVLAADPLIYEIPNVFTPNGDLNNDTYFVTLTNAKSFEATITNRWGNKMKILNGLNDSWDGKSNGAPAAEGIYYLLYEIEGMDGSHIKGQTIIHLER